MAVRLFQNVLTYSAPTATAVHSVVSVVDLNQAGKVPDRVGVHIIITGPDTGGVALTYGFAGCWDSAGTDLMIGTASDASQADKFYFMKKLGLNTAAINPALVSASDTEDANYLILGNYLSGSAIVANANFPGYATPYMAFIVDKTLWAVSVTASVTVEATG